ncbi:unnamed protein product [Ostreobium quekettii]|uniref:Protein kinase domain-containing protein n=1 Tax=Ostreobium quekettii TaxID=121088 RepID=A0A8S1IWS5_9CHLO|nr:unnamed protein product [Ostreobium quekettii]
MARAVRERLEPAAAKGRAGTAPGSKVPTPKFGELEPLQTIGTGSFSRVRLVRNNNNGKYCALKSLKKAHLMKLKQVEHVISEKKILGEVHHPFIANLISTYQDAQCVYMLLEYVPGGELFYHLKKAGRFGVSTVRFYVAGIAVVLEHLHAQNIVYRDLKPENIMIDTNGYLKVTDFGFAKKVYDRTWTLCGTPEYLAPEVIQSRGHGRGVDWWGLGVMMFELLAGYPPFHHENPFVIYQRILEGRVDFPKHFDPWAKARPAWHGAHLFCRVIDLPFCENGTELSTLL